MQDFDEKYTVKIGNETVAEFTVNDYLIRAYNEKKTPEMADLASKLYDFGQSLATYRKENVENTDAYYMVAFKLGGDVSAEDEADKIQRSSAGTMTRNSQEWLKKMILLTAI